MVALRTDAQRHELRGELERQRQLLRARIRRSLLESGNEYYHNLAGEVADAGDNPVASDLVQIQFAEITHDVSELRADELALHRLGIARYGICVTCGLPIGYARLRALPTALRCESCQREQELRIRTAYGQRLV